MGLDGSNPLFFVSSKCSPRRSPNFRPDSVSDAAKFFLQKVCVQVMQLMIFEVVQTKWLLTCNTDLMLTHTTENLFLCKALIIDD